MGWHVIIYMCVLYFCPELLPGPMVHHQPRHRLTGTVLPFEVVTLDSCLSIVQLTMLHQLMHIGFLACFHAISLEPSNFKKIAFSSLVILNLLASLIGFLVHVACCAGIAVYRHTDTHRGQVLHAYRGLTEL